MFVAMGVGAYATARGWVVIGVAAFTAGAFHLMTHAFFKALLFLGSGSVIHAMGGEQDMRKMGGLRKHLPTTYRTFVIGSLAIAGIPPFAGFFSKDEILGSAAQHGEWVLYGVGLLTAGLTAFYMFRAVFMTFWGDFRGTHEQEHHLHESPPSMTVPLWVLAAGAIVAGLVGLPKLLGEHVNLFHNFSDPIVYQIVGHPIGEHEMAVWTELTLMLVAVGVALLGIFLAAKLYGPTRGLATEEAWERRFPAL